MVDFIELLTFGVIGFISGVLTILTLIYQLEKRNFFENILENVLNDVATNEEMQTNLYKIGGLVGQGFKGGFGIDLPVKNRGGKFKIQDIILELIGKSISNSIVNPSPSPGPSPIPQAQDLKEHKLSDKW